MLTTMALWAIYFASYLLDYILILGILIWKKIVFCRTNGIAFLQTIDHFTWGILLVFIVGALIITLKIQNIPMNTRIKSVPDRNITQEMTGYVFAQVVTIATTIFSDWWVLINLTLFIAFGVYFVKSKQVYTSPIFVIPLGNRIYQAGNDVIITKYTLQEMKIKQEDNVNGIEARELTNRVFYVRK